jgi:hypothetical protein
MATAISTVGANCPPIVIQAEPFVAAGFGLHWLHMKEKRPIGEGWQDRPVASFEQLRRTYQPGNNVGVRLGDKSRVDGGYLHLIDLDIRKPEQAGDAWATLRKLLPDVSFDALPSVISGSGGESRHLYFVTDQPFASKKLARSTEFEMFFDPRLKKVVKKHGWEIELFGGPKQAVMPPSIHPDTGLPYRWEREFDFDRVDGVPRISVAAIERAGAIVNDLDDDYEGDTERLGLTLEGVENILAVLPLEEWCEPRGGDRSDVGWVKVGMAVKHELGDPGYDLWCEFSKQSTKYDEQNQLTVWKSFKGKTPKPFTMASLQKAAWVEIAMSELSDLPDVSATLVDDSVDEFDALLTLSQTAISDDDVFSIGLESPASDWKSLLAFTEKGGVVANLPNIELIMKNDPRLKGLPQLNEFTQETVQRTAPGHKSKSRASAAKDARQLEGPIWQVRDTLNGEAWSTARDYAVRSIIETPKTQGGYDIKVSDRDLKAATVLAAHESGFHPIREYLERVVWDGVERIDRLFVDYLGSDDNVYTRQVARLMMVAAVARVFEPGCKWDHAVILEGVQGVGKSTFIRILGRNWSVELDGNFHDPKDMVEKLQGGWIVELPELSGFSKADVQSIKAFVSRQFDKVRLAYEARAQEFPRQSILIGSTNDREYLRDATGGRRFLPIECHVTAIDNARFRKEVDQYWAEAMAVYQRMHAELENASDGLPLYLTGDALALAADLQESRRVETAEDGLVGRIASWLDTPVTSGSVDDDAVPQFRNVTCLDELFRALSADDKTIARPSVQRALTMVPGWKKGAGANARHLFPKPVGRQRCFERIGSPGRLQPISAATSDAAA